MKKYLAAIFVLAFVLACHDEPVPGPGPDELAPDVVCRSGKAGEITNTAASLYGQLLARDGTNLSGSRVGFRFRQKDSTWKFLQMDSIFYKDRYIKDTLSVRGGKYKTRISGLRPDSTYTYCAIAWVRDTLIYTGDTLTFTTTKDLCFTEDVDPDSVSEFAAEIYGSAYPRKDTQNDTIGIFMFRDDPAAAGKYIQMRDSVAAGLSRDNKFSIIFRGLHPDSTYYYRSYYKYNSALESSDIFLGELKSFKTPALPDQIVTTDDITGKSEFKATLHGQVKVKTRASMEKTAWFLFGPDPENLDSLSVQLSNPKDGVMDMELRLDTLRYGVKYYCQACCKLDYFLEKEDADPFYSRVYKGGTLDFTTLEIVPQLQTIPASGVSEFGAVLNGTLDRGSTEPVNTTVWFKWGMDPDVLDRVAEADLDDDGTFSFRLGNLDYGTTYYYQACARVYDQELSAKVLSFTTLDITAKVQTGVAEDITEFTAVLNGVLYDVSNNSFQQESWFLFGPEGSTVEALIAGGKRFQGSFIDNNYPRNFQYALSGLHYGTTYSYVACARVHDREFYGEVASFSTVDVVAGVSVDDASDITEFQATLSGSLDDNSGPGFSKIVHFYYGDGVTADELVAGGQRALVEDLGDGKFRCRLKSLLPGTAYNYVACFDVYDVRFDSEVKQFTTVSVEQEFGNVQKELKLFGATLSCTLVDQDLTSQGLGRSIDYYYSDVYDTVDQIKAGGKRVRAKPVMEDPIRYSAELADLKAATEYHFFACLNYQGMEFSGPVDSFTTAAVQLVLETGEACAIKDNGATLTCTLSGQDYLDLAQAGKLELWFYTGQGSTAEELIVGGNKVYATYANGVFTADVTGLEQGTRYYFVPMLQFVSGARYFGSVGSFTTLAVQADVVTEAVAGVGYHKAVLHGSVGNITTPQYQVKAWFLWSDDQSAETWTRTPAVYNAQAGTFGVELSALEAGKKYWYMACVSVKDIVFRGEERSFSTRAVPDGMVDLGLSVCWAPANVGAEYPQEAGTFYTWADANALDLILPGREQMEELRKGCNWTWTTVNNVQGYLVQGKSTGNSIFLPAAGAIYWDNPVAGENGFWSSESRVASDGIKRGYYLRYNSSLVSVEEVNVNSYKFPVRAISD